MGIKSAFYTAISILLFFVIFLSADIPTYSQMCGSTTRVNVKTETCSFKGPGWYDNCSGQTNSVTVNCQGSSSNCTTTVLHESCIVQSTGRAHPQAYNCVGHGNLGTVNCSSGGGTTPPPSGGGGGGGCNASTAQCQENRTCTIVKGECRNVPNNGPSPPHQNPATHPYRRECDDDEEVCYVSSRTCKSTSVTSCTPAACPVGSSPTGTGPLVTTTSCTHRASGACTGSGDICNYSCPTATKIQNCYATFTDPPVVSSPVIINTPSLLTTPLGCFAENITGRDVNNAMQVRMNATDPNGASDIRAFVLWLNNGGTAPTISTSSGTGTPTATKNSFGFMVGYVSNQWRVFAPRVNGSTWTWVNVNSAGNGERARIKGPGGKDMLIISDVSVSDTGANSRRLNAKLEAVHSDSGITNWESITTASYSVSAAALDESRFFQGSNTTLAQNPQYSSMGTWTIDLEPPVRESITQSIVNAQRLNVNWRFTDFSGIKRVVGNAQPTGEGTIVGPISNITSGVSNYEIGSIPQGTDRYSGSNLWGVNSLGQRVELLDIGDNEGDVFELLINPFDNACNTDDYIHSLGLGGPWMITKGGVVFSAGGINMNIQTLEGNQPISPDPYFSGEMRFIRDEADLGTELVTSGSSTQLLSLVHSVKLGSSGVRGYQDANNRQGYWFNELSRRFRSRNTSDPAKYTHVELGSTTLSGATGNLPCTSDTSCVITVDGNLTINPGFICDTNAVFLVDGNINVSPNITASNSSSGCMFVSSQNITIGAGAYQSAGSSYPKYDVIDGYFIAEGNIVIPEVDRDEDIRDGLVVRGGLVALGTNEARSVQLGRSLKLVDNNNFPTLAIHSDNRYLNFSVQVFGGYSETIKRDVGFKPW